MKTVYRVVIGDPIQRKIYGRDVFLTDPKDAIMDMFTLVTAVEEMYGSPFVWDDKQNFAIGSQPNSLQILKGHLLGKITEDPFYLEIQTKNVPKSYVCGDPLTSALTLTEKQEAMMENLSEFLLLIEQGDIQII